MDSDDLDEDETIDCDLSTSIKFCRMRYINLVAEPNLDDGGKWRPDTGIELPTRPDEIQLHPEIEKYLNR